MVNTAVKSSYFNDPVILLAELNQIDHKLVVFLLLEFPANDRHVKIVAKIV